MHKYIRLIRAHHYIKNAIVWVPLACSGQLFAQSQKLWNGFLGFLSFCLISSVVYIINDIRDLDKDRLHPAKCKRPLASGAISVSRAKHIGICLFLFCVLLCLALNNAAAVCLLLLYLVLNLLYSIGLKNIPLLDLIILVSGFLLRMLYGACICDIEVSNWLYLTVFSVSFYLALGKRRNELKKNGGTGETRPVLRSYPVSFLDRNMYMCQALTNVFYALWCVDEQTIQFYHNRNLIFTVPIVMLITMKYSMNLENDSSMGNGDPVDVLLHDKMLVLLCLVYFGVMFLSLYILK